MSYVLIGETSVDDGPLYVLWTRDASGVRVLPIGSQDRRLMQVIGRRIMEAWMPATEPGTGPERDTAALQSHADRQAHRLVELADSEREAIAKALELRERDEPAFGVA